MAGMAGMAGNAGMTGSAGVDGMDRWFGGSQRTMADTCKVLLISGSLRSRSTSSAVQRPCRVAGYPRRSMIVALAWPPPSHIVCRP
jgi:hypothetical protein